MMDDDQKAARSRGTQVELRDPQQRTFRQVQTGLDLARRSFDRLLAC